MSNGVEIYKAPRWIVRCALPYVDVGRYPRPTFIQNYACVSTKLIVLMFSNICNYVLCPTLNDSSFNRVRVMSHIVSNVSFPTVVVNRFCISLLMMV